MTGGGQGSRSPERAGPSAVRRTRRPGDRERSSSATGFCRRRAASSPRFSPSLLAFLISGVVVLVTTGSVSDTLQTYRRSSKARGSPGSSRSGTTTSACRSPTRRSGSPGTRTRSSSIAAANLQQTLILWVALVLTGLAVAFAFRCGLFNIGGQGQYLAGSIAAVLVATELPEGGRPSELARSSSPRCSAACWPAQRRRDRRAPQGHGRRPRGDHDDHAQLDRPLGRLVLLRHRRAVPDRCAGTAGAVPSSEDIVEKAKLACLLGRSRSLQGVHIGLFVAVARSSSTRSRSTGRRSATRCGRSATIPRRRATAASASRENYFLAMAIAGVFAGLAGALDILGWEFRLDTTQIQGSTIGFIGIAVALLGRNTAVGVGLAALLFAALADGDRVAQPRPGVLPAGSRVESRDHHPGAHRPLRRSRRHRPARAAPAQAETRGRRRPREATSARQARRRLGRRPRRRLRRPRRTATDPGAEPGRAGRDRPLRAHDRHRLVDPRRAADRRLRDRCRRARVRRSAISRPARASSTSKRSSSGARCSRRRSATRRRSSSPAHRRPLLRALRRREHRSRGDDAHGRVLRRLGRRRDGHVDARAR